MSEPATVFVVDDDPAVRDALRLLIRSVGLEVECFAGAEEFLSAYRPDRMGCLVLDIRMPGMSGLELLELLVERGVTLPTIIITGHADVRMAVRAMKLGSVDFLEKPFGDQVLLDQIHLAIAICQERRAQSANQSGVQARLASLTEREREVMALLVDGQRNWEIAARLNLRTRTVEGYRARLMRRLGVRTLAEVVQIGMAARKQSAGMPDIGRDYEL